MTVVASNTITDAPATAALAEDCWPPVVVAVGTTVVEVVATTVITPCMPAVLQCVPAELGCGPCISQR